ncbi:hypothetical protein JW868_04825 [Candidatus Woesearchaeota archaeon]|nr:hypothetical protein [Candidatus Woesearchaeota archaeon]
MKKKEIKEKLDQGYIQINVIFELLGSPKSHVEKTIKAFIQGIKVDPNVIFLQEEFGEVEEREGNLYSTFAEVDMLILGLEKITFLCFNYTPASLEIVEPGQLTFRTKDLTNWINDLLAKLHEVSTVTKAFNSKNQMLQQNINALLHNAIMLSIKQAKTEKEIAQDMGLPVKTVKPMLDLLVKDKKINLKDKKYLRMG